MSTPQFPPGQPQPPFYQPPPGPPPPVKLKRSWYRRGWAIALIALFIGVGIGQSSAKTKNVAVAGPVTTTTATATTTEQVTTTVQPTKVIATHTVTATVTYTPPPVNQFTDGTFRIGADIPPGVYKTAGGQQCYYAVLNSLNNQDIASNDNFSGPTVVQVPSSAAAFETSGGCSWSRVG